MTNRYLENTHVFYSSLNSEQSIQSIMWYENSTSINLTVRNQNKKGLGGKSAEIRLSPVYAQELAKILQNYIGKSDVALPNTNESLIDLLRVIYADDETTDRTKRMIEENAHIAFGEWCEACTLPGDICKCKKSEVIT